MNFRFIITAFLSIFVMALSAQTIDEVHTLYNDGGTAYQEGNIELAIQKFEDCAAMCNTLYEEEEDVEAEELMLGIQQKLPTMYWQLSQSSIKAKDYNSSLEYALKTKEAAQNINNEDLVSKASKLASKIYYSFGLSKYKAKNYPEAITNLDNSIAENTTNFKAHLLKVVIYKTTGDDEALISATKAVMAVPGNDDNKNKAIKLTANYFYNKGVTAKKSSDYPTAIKNIEISFEFKPENADAYFLLASIYNTQKNWDKAIETANKGLEYESDEADAQARFYYEMGNSYIGKSDNTNACSSFNKAAVGVYTENANYQITEVLKCN